MRVKTNKKEGGKTLRYNKKQKKRVQENPKCEKKE